MTTEEKSDDINFDNEQVEQRTLGSDEERKIKEPEENKTSSKSNEKKNKTPNKFNKIKLPPIKKGKKGQQLYKGMEQPMINTGYNPNNFMNLNSTEDEELYPEIKIVKKDIRNLNRELKNLKNDYYLMEEQNLTYKYMIEKILSSKQNQTIDDNNNNENVNNENNEEKIDEGEKYIKERITEEAEEFKNNEKLENQNKKKKSKKNKPKSDADIKISVLKKQNYLYDNTLLENDNELEELRKKEKSIQYQQLVYSINAKSDELNENLMKIEKLNQTLMEYDTKIKYYMVKAQMFNNEIYKIDREVEDNKKMMERFDEDIKEYKSKKESIN